MHEVQGGKISRGYANVIDDASPAWFEESILVELYLEDAHFKEFYSDVVMGSVTPNIGLIDPICIEPLNVHFISFTSYHPLSSSCIS